MLAERLLDEDDTFTAGSPLENCDADHTSPIIAIGDSMSNKLRFGERAQRGEVGKVSLVEEGSLRFSCTCKSQNQ